MITTLATAIILLAICSNTEIILMSNHQVNSPIILRCSIRQAKGGKACIRDHHYLCLLNLRSTIMATKLLKPTSSTVQHSIVTMAATQRTQRLLHPFHTTLAFSTLWTSLLRLLSIRPSNRYARVSTCILTPPVPCVTASIRSSRISRHLAVVFLLLHAIQRRKEIMAQEKLSIVLILTRQLSEQELTENGESSSILNYEIFEIRKKNLILFIRTQSQLTYCYLNPLF